ncbi:hypothetical protein H5410_001511 [Solanum commersonii]|uniref:Uncharacterized protein n=1 Tax=Solanum commersonii TaxID=4109 RepID=A0A9J6AZT7_SOLCO|nr:hypothetical protein H5410_001511 [Solanum commersonii]
MRTRFLGCYKYLDEYTGKIQEHQGQDENSCRLILKKNQDHNHKNDGVVGDYQYNGEKLQGDLQNNLNKKTSKHRSKDDTLNTTVTLNFTLATDGVTSDSFVPVINLESNLASNPKLHVAGVVSGKILAWL